MKKADRQINLKKKQTKKNTYTSNKAQEIFGMHSVSLVGVCKRLHALLSFSQLTATGDSVLAVCVYSHRPGREFLGGNNL